MEQVLASPESVPKAAVEEVLTNLAKSDAAQFRSFFERIRDVFPDEVKRACLRHVVEHNSEPVAEDMVAWLVANGGYFPLLLDPEFLPREKRHELAALLRTRDPRFFVNFGQLTNNSGLKAKVEPGQNATQLYAALQLLENVEQHNILLPWLLGLTHHDEAGIRSKAAKLICKLQPSPEVIKRQFKSTDPRVRANAVEALWGLSAMEATEIYQQALSDGNHRVVVNALVGLCLQDRSDDTAFQYLLTLSDSPSEMLRIATIWAFGYLEDRRAIPALERLAADPTESVRTKAASVLAAFGSCSTWVKDPATSDPVRWHGAPEDHSP